MAEEHNELYRKYRPKLFKQVLGQDEAVAILDKFVKTKKVPHSMLLSGPSGCGKTTIARILQTKLHCHDMDFHEINAASTRGVDTIRDIDSKMRLHPIENSRIYLLDEAHKLTNDAQNSILKMLEDTPNHVYFFLATTDPGKLISTVRNRCTEIKLKTLSPKLITSLVQDISLKENIKLTEEVIERIIDVSEGSARKAIVTLQSIMQLSSDDEQITYIEKNNPKKQAFDLVKALLWERAKWADVRKIILALDEGTDWEGLRYLVLANATNELLKGGKTANKAYLILECFRQNWYDCKKAGLVMACWEVLGG